MSTKDNLNNIKNTIYLKLSDPKFISKIGISIACISAITTLVLTDFGHIKDTDALVCCYGNTSCYGNVTCW